MDGITDSMDMSLGELLEMVKDRKACRAEVHGVTKSRTRLSDRTELTEVTSNSYYTVVCKDTVPRLGWEDQHLRLVQHEAPPTQK